MGITISWTKSWSSTDDGTILAGADLQNLQVNMQSALTNAASNVAVNTYTGSGIPYRTIVLTPGGATLPTTNPAGRANTDGTNLSYMTLDFDKDTDEIAYWIFKVPDSLTGTTANVNIAWTSAVGSATNEVQFEISSGGRANDEVLDAALGTAVELDDLLIATGDVHLTPTVSLTHGWTAGDLAIVKLIRDINGPSGTDIDGDVKVLAVVIEYQAGSSTD
jgi:hypothetical protein